MGPDTASCLGDPQVDTAAPPCAPAACSPQAPPSITEASKAQLGRPSRERAGGSLWWVAHWAGELRFQPQSESWVISIQRGHGTPGLWSLGLLWLPAPGLCCGHQGEWAGHRRQWACGLMGCFPDPPPAKGSSWVLCVH